ncbi:pyrroline-5-carboxylate reductase [Porticoccus litoralis]|uniref:Pyrroline-5-carboxylate reductase n=1 Tax=Porticoccus litoralis TaxID=434086 RepID=A0AAW8B4N1_9GAMM|nr:pyrroline-5-carboxylate reductase [Porticoccus litoralis]MDP1520852.1 pyrroline-5-carboxylate reductase [Porticoccus litoralis]
MIVSKPKLTFIGGGNMATSLIGGLVDKGYPANAITATDPLEASRLKLAQSFGINTSDNNPQACADADVILLAVKPQVMKSVLQGLAGALNHRPLIISIAAGISMDSLAGWLGGELPIVRCMPNTPALVQTGASGLYANSQVSAEQKALAEQILQAVGIVCWLENEADIDVVTAVSGSGPAYYFLVMEIMQRIGEELGLPEEVARQLTLQTALGAARMALESDVDSAELRRRVTSPGGTTQRAIETFESGDLEALFRKAMNGAAERAREMASELAD